MHHAPRDLAIHDGLPAIGNRERNNEGNSNCTQMEKRSKGKNKPSSFSPLLDSSSDVLFVFLPPPPSSTASKSSTLCRDKRQSKIAKRI